MDLSKFESRYGWKADIHQQFFVEQVLISVTYSRLTFQPMNNFIGKRS